MYIPHYFHPLICPWILGYCEQCCSEHGCTDTCLSSCFHFFWLHTQKLITGSCGNFMFNFLRIHHTVSTAAGHILANTCSFLFVFLNCFIIAILMGVTLQIFKQKVIQIHILERSVTCIVESRLNWVRTVVERKSFRSLFAGERR